MDDFELTPDLLLHAYSAGIFPMAEGRDDPEIFWVDPKRRGIIPLEGFHVSRSLKKRLLKPDYHVALEPSLFEAVLDGCANRSETWINEKIRELMIALAQKGMAHAFSVMRGDQLIGGLYGLTIGGAFFGESMFSTERDASKIALAYAVDHLRQCGFILFDTQFLTDHLASLGAVEIGRNEYHALLEAAITKRVSISKLALETDAQAVVQRMTQTS